jgi:hypothetical protein
MAEDLGPGNTGVNATLKAIVWPVYVGVSNQHPGGIEGACPHGEPWGHPDYERGQITWERQPGGEILGRALIKAPPGIWTHWVFCSGYQQAALMDTTQMDFPTALQQATIIDLRPIKGPTGPAIALPRQNNGIQSGGMIVNLGNVNGNGVR